MAELPKDVTSLRGGSAFILGSSTRHVPPGAWRQCFVPTLILHGDDDQIVPIGASALLSSKIVKGATLKVYPGAPHGLCTTLKDRVNADLLAFIKG
jgi:pimeloyl-ACP methyl ester carboxylesterase